MIFIKLFLAEIKACSTLLIRSALMLLSLVFILGLLCVGAAGLLKNSALFERVDIGVVMSDGDVLTKDLVKMFSLMDSVSELTRILPMEKEAADNALKEGELGAVVFLTEDFFHDVNNGKNTPVTVKINLESFPNVNYFKGLLTAAVSMVDTVEGAIYAAGNAADRGELAFTRKEVEVLLTDVYKDRILYRGDLFSESEELPLQGMDIGTYYRCSGVVILFLLFSLILTGRYRRDPSGVKELLAVRGIHGIEVGLLRQGAFSVLFFLMILFSTMLWELPAVERGAAFDRKPLSLFLAVMVSMLSAAALHLCGVLFEKREISSGAVFPIAAGVLLFSGALIPSAFFPEWLARLSACSGAPQFFRLLSCAVSGSGETGRLCLMAAAGTVVLTVLAEIIRKVRESGEARLGVRDVGAQEKAVGCKFLPGGRTAILLRHELLSSGLLLKCILCATILLIVAGIRLPDAQNPRIAYSSNGSVAAARLFEETKKNGEPFVWVECTDEWEVRRLVKSGAVDCGFVTCHDFGERLEAGDTEKMITCIRSVFSMKSRAAEEILFAAFLKLQVPRTLTAVTDDPAVSKRILWEAGRITDSERVFHVRFYDVKGRVPEAEKERFFPVHRTAVVLLFTGILFTLSGILSGRERGPSLMMPVKERRRFEAFRAVVFTLPMLLLLWGVSSFFEPMGNLLLTGGLFVLLAFCTWMWGGAVMFLILRGRAALAESFAVSAGAASAALALAASSDLLTGVPALMRAASALLPSGWILYLLEKMI